MQISEEIDLFNIQRNEFKYFLREAFFL